MAWAGTQLIYTRNLNGDGEWTIGVPVAQPGPTGVWHPLLRRRGQQQVLSPREYWALGCPWFMYEENTIRSYTPTASFHEINSHEINCHQINSHEINLPPDQLSWDQFATRSTWFYVASCFDLVELELISTKQYASIPQMSIAVPVRWCLHNGYNI